MTFKYREGAEQLARTIHRDYKPGDRFLTYAQIRAEFADRSGRPASTGRVEQMVDVLIERGLLRTEPGCGIFVTAPPDEDTPEARRSKAMSQLRESRDRLNQAIVLHDAAVAQLLELDML
jgi:DNA-binding GntR family transcriptional regulator